MPLESVAWNCVADGRQPVAHDRFHARLAEGAARLLVGEDVLQLDHLARQVGDGALRLVDHRQPLAELGQALMRPARGLAHRLADAVAEAVEPVRQAAHLAGDLALVVAQLRQPRRDAVLARFFQHRHAPRRPAPGGEGDDQQHEQQHRCPAGEQHGTGDGHLAELIGRVEHPVSIARIGREYKTGTDTVSARSIRLERTECTVDAQGAVVSAGDADIPQHVIVQPIDRH